MKNLKSLSLTNQFHLNWACSFTLLSKLDSLEEIELKYCNLNNKQNKFYGLKNINYLKKLKNLTIIDSTLDFVPFSIIGCSNLEELSINAPIKHIPKEIASLKSLRNLTISWHDTSFPIEIFELTNLERLDLRGSLIINLPEELSNLKKLKELWISDTPFANELDFYHRLKQYKELESIKKLMPKCKIYLTTPPPDGPVRFP